MTTEVLAERRKIRVMNANWHRTGEPACEEFDEPTDALMAFFLEWARLVTAEYSERT